MHVSIMIFSYTIFIVGGLISLILLVRALPFLRVPAFFNEKSDEKKNSQKKEAYSGKKLLISNFNEISEISSKTNLEIFPNFWEKAMSPFLLFGNKEIQLAYLGLIKKRNQFPFYSNLSNYSSNVSFPTGNNISQEKESGNFLNLNSFSYTFPSYIVDSVPFFPNFKESFLPPEFSKLSSKVMASNYSGDKQSLKRQKNKSEMIKLFGIGFPLFTLGILSGAVWANSAWGSYWSWDIKECGSLVQWLTIAFYLHC
uniref:Heme attachment to plastid cytochrome c n=1 Tax=Cephaleuros karstenii TaxID=1985640 RepID=UPI001EDC97F5|nr:Heme attachment to plastid cytochrome c [Cephaleuros karstenii]UIB39117.1 Heme attachment to plastid cytochrome c [Cephaleuros karstenii]